MAGVVQSAEAWASSILPGFHEGCGCSLQRTLASVSSIVPQVNVFLGVGAAHGAPQDDHLETIIFERFAARHDKAFDEYERRLFGIGPVGERAASAPVGGVAGEAVEYAARAVAVEQEMNDEERERRFGQSRRVDQPVTNSNSNVGEVAEPAAERLQPEPPPYTPPASAYERYVDLKDRQLGE